VTLTLLEHRCCCNQAFPCHGLMVSSAGGLHTAKGTQCKKNRGKRGLWIVMLCGMLVLASGCSDDDNGGGGGGGATAGDDHGQTAATATGVNANSQTAGVLNTAQDVDVFQITLPSRGTLIIRTSGPTDTVGGLFRSLDGCPATGNFDGAACANNLIEVGDDEDDPNFRIFVPNLPAGTYFAVVEAFDQPGNYTFISSFTATP